MPASFHDRGVISHASANETICLQYLTPKEANQIHQRFRDPSVRQTRQVLWTGVERGLAQKWADQRGVQTLTTIMGCLMQPEDPSCLKNKKSVDAWSRYMKGASAIFAHYATQGQTITVLSPPPPDHFHPSGWTNFQIIEEPILKGQFGGSPVGRIELVHPGVPGAEDFRYELWPTDKTSSWMEKFGKIPVKKVAWREITLRLYRPSGLKPHEFMRCCATCSDKIGLQSKDGKKLLSILSEPSPIDDQGRVVVEKHIAQTTEMPTQKEEKNAMASAKKEKKTQAKKTKKSEQAARKAAGRGTKATVNKVSKTKLAAKKAVNKVTRQAISTEEVLGMRQNNHNKKKQQSNTKANKTKAGKL